MVLLWLTALVGMILISQSIGTAYSNNFSLPNTESTQALSSLQAAAPKMAGDREQIVFHTTDGTKVTDPSVMASVTTMLAKVEKVPHVTSVTSPYGSGGAHQISADGTTAFATVTFDQLSAEHLQLRWPSSSSPTAQTAERTRTLQVAVAGQVAEAADRLSFGGTGLGILLAGVVLLLVFGSVFAMALPAGVGPRLPRHRHRGDRAAQPRSRRCRSSRPSWCCSSASASGSTTPCSS